MILPDDIQRYTVEIPLTGDWVCFRDPIYPIASVPPAHLGHQNRFSGPGEYAYYFASGVETAQAEVPDWRSREAFTVKAGTINAFNLAQWCADHHRQEEFLRSKQQGGYDLCQNVARELTGQYGMTGILALSAGQNARGQNGYCLALYTPSGINPSVFISDPSLTGQSG